MAGIARAWIAGTALAALLMLALAKLAHELAKVVRLAAARALALDRTRDVERLLALARGHRGRRVAAAGQANAARAGAVKVHHCFVDVAWVELA